MVSASLTRALQGYMQSSGAMRMEIRATVSRRSVRRSRQRHAHLQHMCWIKLAYLAPTVNYSPRQFGFSQYTCCATFLLVRLIVKCACVKLRLYKALPVRRPSLYCSRRPRQSSLLMTSTAYNIPCSDDPYILFPRFLCWKMHFNTG